MTIIEDRLPFLETLRLESGGHSPDGVFCVMEAAAYLAGEPWSDKPQCVSPVIATFMRTWNDGLNDEDRQMLVPLIPPTIGTKTTKKDEARRAWMCVDWLARECAPAFLRCAGLAEQAVVLEGLAPLVSAASAKKAQPALNASRRDAAAARAAAGAAARDAARAAGWDAARAAAGAAGWDAAWDAARDAARAAGWDAAGDAAGDALEAAVKILQPSALLLVNRMCEVGR